jgi:epoxyqueuosine reductase QueG
MKSHLDKPYFRYGYADMRGLLSGKYAEYSHGISIIRRLDDRIIEDIVQGPTAEYHGHYNDVNSELNRILESISHELTGAGIRNMPVKATVHDSELDAEYFTTLRHDFSHKMTATRAGLGWIGRTDLLVSEDFGPRVRLASMLVDYPLKDAGIPVTESRCGSCRICIDACPGNAASGMLWNTSVDRNEFFDPFRCRDYCRKISMERLNEVISLCGKCIQVCPHGKKIHDLPEDYSSFTGGTGVQFPFTR